MPRIPVTINFENGSSIECIAENINLNVNPDTHPSIPNSINYFVSRQLSVSLDNVSFNGDLSNIILPSYSQYSQSDDIPFRGRRIFRVRPNNINRRLD